MVEVFSELFNSISSFAGSSDYLFGFVFCMIGVLALMSGILRLIKV